MRAGLCELCRQRRAEFAVSRMVGGRCRDEWRLCAACAGDNERVLCGDSSLSLAELLEVCIGRLSVSEGEQNRTKVCPGCGNTVEEAKRTGMMGCSMCYVSFRDDIESLITKLHGFSLSQGKPT